jgi:hypothetical protein
LLEVVVVCSKGAQRYLRAARRWVPRVEERGHRLCGHSQGGLVALWMQRWLCATAKGVVVRCAQDRRGRGMARSAMVMMGSLSNSKRK